MTVLQPAGNRAHFGSTGSDRFLVLPENRFAYTAITDLAAEPRRHAAPLIYLYGPSGTGKSHLARHCARLRVRDNGDHRTRMLTAADFAARLAEASETQTIPDFQQSFRNLDLFVLEDLHSLENRPESQRQLLSILDDLVAHETRILLTGRKPAGELEGFSAKLINRCHGGVSALIQLPGPASRESLLAHFAQSRHIPLSPEVSRILAEACAVGPRELLGLIVQLETTAQHERSRIDAAFVRRYLKADVTAPQLTVDEIARSVARQFDISLTQLRSRARVRGLVLPRQCAMFLARELTSERLEKIGKYFGNRDHSTVVHSCNRIHEMLPEQAELRQHLSQIRRVLGADKPISADSRSHQSG